MIDRRQWMRGAAVSAAFLADRTGAAKDTQPFFLRHGLALGVQLYALAPDLGKDLDGTLAKLSAIGIRTVETAGFYGRTATEIRAAFDRAGLRCVSAHIPMEAHSAGDLGLDGNLDALADAMHVIGITNVVLPSPSVNLPVTSLATFVAAFTALSKDDWRRTADALNRIGRALKHRGLAISYHNHNVEFKPHDWGTAYDLLLRETDPAVVSFEMDAGWVAAAGIDPVALLRKNPHRFTQMHVKDIKPTTQTNFVVEQDPCEVGSGKMNWPAILPAAYAAGVRNFFVEQEPPYTGPRITSIARGAGYLLAV
jgi:sugar phosphate isomerase/epimerase